MNTTQFQSESNIQINVDLSALYKISSFAAAMTGPNDGTLHTSGGMFLDFDREKVYIRRAPNIDTSYTGVMSLPLGIEDNPPPSMDGMLLLVPLHKVLQIIKWANEDRKSAVGTFLITTEGEVYMTGKNNTIQLQCEWYTPPSDGHSPFESYKGSPMGVLEDIYAAVNKGRELPQEVEEINNYNQVFGLEEHHDMGTYPNWIQHHPPYEKDLEVGKLDSNIRYVDPNDLQECPVEGGDGHPIVLGYSRMGLFFSTLTGNDMSFDFPIHAADKSVPVSYLSSIASFMKSIQYYIKSSEVVVTYNLYKSMMADGNEMHMLSMKYQIIDTEEDIIAVFTIPSAGDVNMAPPSNEDIEMIIPDLDEGPIKLTIPFRELTQNLVFWDNLRKAESKDVVTPLKPVSLSVLEDNILQLVMNSPEGSNEFRVEFEGENVPHDFEIQVPFETLMKTLTSPYLEPQSATDKDVIEIKRVKDTSQPSSLVMQRALSTVIVAEFL